MQSQFAKAIGNLQAASASGGVQPEYRKWAQRVRVSSFPRDFERLSANAYVTMCRTLRGFGTKVTDSTRKTIRKTSDVCLRDHLDILASRPSANIAAFDTWHLSAREQLRSVWAPHFPLTVGQSQKWLNILLKYLTALGGASDFPRVEPIVREFGHAAIDGVVYQAMSNAHDVMCAGATVQSLFRELHLPPWSKIHQQSDYVDLQGALRLVALDHGASASDLELFIW